MGRHKGRRALVIREMSRAATNLDKYLTHCQHALDMIRDDNLEVSGSIETLATFALILQEKTIGFCEAL